jgi:hypothetical protein
LTLTARARRQGARHLERPRLRERTVLSAGDLGGQFDFTVNRKTLNVHLQLHEVAFQGEYVKFLVYIASDSHMRDRIHCHLLMPGERHQLGFQRGHKTNCRF